MSGQHADEVFAGSVPELYDTHMVPLIFAPYAADLVSRLRPRRCRKAARSSPRI
jgi:hypothetical protein